jgi:hypothetical protein
MNTHNNNSNWIDLIENKQAINSLYTKPPSLEQINIKTIDFCPWSYRNIEIGLLIEHIPDIVPIHGLWHTCCQTNSVYMLLEFHNVANFFVENANLSYQYSLDIQTNPDYVYRTILNDNILVLERSDRLQVRLLNLSSHISFFAYCVRIATIRPSGHNCNCSFQKKREIDKKFRIHDGLQHDIFSQR